MSKEPITVLHDFDNPYPSGRYALRRGISLIVYAISKKLRFLRPLTDSIYRECYDYCLTLAKVDRLLGIESHFGIKAEVENEFPTLVSELQTLGFKVHKHYHTSREQVGWDPPLDVKRESWFFDQRYATDGVIPDSIDWAVFHADYPFLIGAYIDFLGKASEEGRVKRR